VTTPSADRVEQETPVVPEPDSDVQVPLEADPADAAEQAAVVELDEDEHRQDAE
jgi:hypothetical protein